MSALLRFMPRTGLLSIAAYAGVKLARRGGRGPCARPGAGGPARRPAAIRPDVAERTMVPGGDYVRPAGPEAVRDPHRRGDRVDEAADESFPASDPPATY